MLTNEQIDAVAESMPGGVEGFLKGWGWQQFARAIEAEVRKEDSAIIKMMSDPVTAAGGMLMPDLSRLTHRGVNAWDGVNAQTPRDVDVP